MSGLAEQLAEAEAQVKRLRQKIAGASCVQVGHDWKFIGASNAGCSADCSCSVPVHECRRCGDCDYGQNDDADDVVRDCGRMRDE